MADEWTNWSGSLRFRPREVQRPRDEEELAAIVRGAAAAGRTVRVVGSRHSSTGILGTDDILVTLDHMRGVIAHHEARNEATVWAGSTLEDLATDLFHADLMLPNFGDVATQRVGGAIGTGTHGTGLKLQILSSMLIGGRLVTAAGDVQEFDADRDDGRDLDLVRALRVGLGTLGVFTQMRLRLEPVYLLQRREWCTTVDACLANLDALIRGNRNFDFYWYPRSDEVKLRLLNAPGGGTMDLKYAALVEDRTGWAQEVIPKHSGLPFRFDEMEYSLPFDAGVDCFLAVRRRMREKWRQTVGWRVLYRIVAADDAYLSPAHGRLSANISLHHNAGLPFDAFFADMEPVLREFGGRPHWAKKHTLAARELRPLYPAWDDFMRVRSRMDPAGTFLSPYLRSLLGVQRDAEASA